MNLSPNYLYKFIFYSLLFTFSVQTKLAFLLFTDNDGGITVSRLLHQLFSVSNISFPQMSTWLTSFLFCLCSNINFSMKPLTTPLKFQFLPSDNILKPSYFAPYFFSQYLLPLIYCVIPLISYINVSLVQEYELQEAGVLPLLFIFISSVSRIAHDTQQVLN